MCHEREVRDLLRAMDREEGFLGGEADLGRVLRAVGEGIWTVGFSGCRGDHYLLPYRNLYDAEKEAGQQSRFPRLLAGCIANATAVTGGDEDTTEASTAVAFTTPRRAEAGLEDRRGFMEGSDLIDIDDARVDDDMVVAELTVYERGASFHGGESGRMLRFPGVDLPSGILIRFGPFGAAGRSSNQGWFELRTWRRVTAPRRMN